MQGKIAVEEHVVTTSFRDQLRPTPFWYDEYSREVQERMVDDGRRLQDMDKAGIERMVLSLAGPGIQDELDTARAVARATLANDELAELVATRPDRYSAFAALPMQDPAAAADELERAVTRLGFKGGLVNGYTSMGNLETPAYYDEPQYQPFWERLAAIDVPLYLHPRNPLPNQQRIYQGRPELLGPQWAFAVETGTHALRLITSGLFDRVPKATVILGHLGELLPFAIDRLQSRIAKVKAVKLARPPSQYLRDNFYVSTSGNFHTPSLIGTIAQVGIDRMLFSIDYPFETLESGSRWLDSAPIGDVDREQISRTNAQRLLRIS